MNPKELVKLAKKVGLGPNLTPAEYREAIKTFATLAHHHYQLDWLNLIERVFEDSAAASARRLEEMLPAATLEAMDEVANRYKSQGKWGG